MLRLLLCIELKSAIHLMEDIAEAPIPSRADKSLSSAQDMQVRNVSLKRVEDTSGIAYISAIALQQSIHKWVEPVQLANQVVRNLFKDNFASKNISRLTAIDLKSFLVKVIPPGFIWFELSDRGIAAWLQHLINPFPDSAYGIDRCVTTISPITASTQALSHTEADILFAAQHVHARCCSLLRLAAEQKVVTIALSKSSLELRKVLLSPIPWFRELPQNSVTSPDLQARFCLIHPSELALIGQLFSLLDLLCASDELEACGGRSIDLSRKVWFKQLDRFNQAFYAFHGNCRIWEEMKRDLPLAQARLGVLAATQTILQLVLENALGSAAPSVL